MKRIGLFGIACLLLFSACSQTEAYAARVAGESITQDDLFEELHLYQENPDLFAILFSDTFLYSGKFVKSENRIPSQAVAAVLTLQIQWDYLVPAALEELDDPVKINEERRTEVENRLKEILADRFDEYDEELIDRVVARRALIDAMNSDAGIALIHAFYDAHPDRFDTHYCFEGVAVATKERGMEARRRLQEGEDLATVHNEFSFDPAVGTNFDCAFPVQIYRSSPEFFHFLPSLEGGDYAPPFQLGEFYPVLKVDSAEPTVLSPTVFPDNTLLGSAIYEEFFFSLYEPFFNSETPLEVQINPRFGTWLLRGPESQVQMPDVPLQTGEEGPAPGFVEGEGFFPDAVLPFPEGGDPIDADFLEGAIFLPDGSIALPDGTILPPRSPVSIPGEEPVLEEEDGGNDSAPENNLPIPLPGP